MTTVTVVTDKATGYSRWKRAVTAPETEERARLRCLLKLRIGQVAKAIPLEGIPFPGPQKEVTEAWSKSFAAWFIEGRSHKELSDGRLHRYILEIESWAADKGVTFPDPPKERRRVKA